jgi:hypothetical protein
MHTRAACYPVSYKPTVKDRCEAWLDVDCQHDMPMPVTWPSE